MTVNECAKRDQNTREKILTIFQSDGMLREHLASVDVRIDHARIVLSGFLPSEQLVNLLVPAIRRAGVLGQVAVQVRVPA